MCANTFHLGSALKTHVEGADLTACCPKRKAAATLSHLSLGI